MKINKIKILYTLSSLHGGGAERVAINLLKNFNKEKFYCALFLHKKEGKYLHELPNELQVYYLLQNARNIFLKKILSLISLPWLLIRLIIIGRNYDVLIAGLEATYVTYATILSGLINKKPLIVIVHNDISKNTALKQSFHFRILKLLYPYCTQCICVSKGVMDGVLHEIPYIKGKIIVCYNPLEIGNIARLADEPIDPHIKGHYIISSGRLEHIKRFDLLIQAHHKVLKEGIQHQLLIIGEGGCRSKLQKLAESLGVASSVKLIGFEDNPYKWVSKAYCFVLSSENEGFGNVIVEALAVGTPVISTDCPSGPREILEDGKYGILVSNKSVDEIAYAIINLFNDPERYTYFKSVGRSRANVFSIEKVIIQWEELIVKTHNNFYNTLPKVLR